MNEYISVLPGFKGHILDGVSLLILKHFILSADDAEAMHTACLV